MKISELRRGIPSVILTGNINKDGSIMVKTSSNKYSTGKESHKSSDNSFFKHANLPSQTHSNVVPKVAYFINPDNKKHFSDK